MMSDQRMPNHPLPHHVKAYPVTRNIVRDLRRFALHPSSVNYWLVKQEPSDYSWEDFVKEKGTAWTGVRNFQARNNLRTMKRGDRVLFYHSGDARAVVGVAEVRQEAHADPTAEEGDWVCVDLKPVRAFQSPVELSRIKADAKLAGIALVKQSRLSVMPLTAREFKHLLRMGGLSA